MTQDNQLPDRIETFIEAVGSADNLDKIFHALLRHVQDIGFERFSYWLVWPPTGPQRQICITNYPNDWAEYYLDENLASDDLVGRHAVTSTTPFLWEGLAANRHLTNRQRMVFCEGADAGLRAGGTVPIHGPLRAQAVFSVANETSDAVFAKQFRSHRHEIQLVATYAHENILRLGLADEVKSGILLTPREVEIITWVSRGKSRVEVAIILGVEETTVKHHLEHVREKLDATNTTHAITKAIMGGLILPWGLTPINNTPQALISKK